jgi:protein involved in polysaccharide export with SLBB domain
MINIRSACLFAVALLLLAVIGMSPAHGRNLLDDPSSQPTDQIIEVGDTLTVSIELLLGEGVGPTVVTPRVDKNGKIKLPFIDPLTVKEKTTEQAAEAITQAYKAAKMADSRATVHIAAIHPSTEPTQ